MFYLFKIPPKLKFQATLTPVVSNKQLWAYFNMMPTPLRENKPTVDSQTPGIHFEASEKLFNFS